MFCSQRRKPLVSTTNHAAGGIAANDPFDGPLTWSCVRSTILTPSQKKRQDGALKLSTKQTLARLGHHVRWFHSRRSAAFLRIDHGDGCDVDDILDLRASLHKMNRLCHAGKDRSYSFTRTKLRQNACCDVARLQIGEDQHVGSALQPRERKRGFQPLCVDRKVRLHFSVNH